MYSDLGDLKGILNSLAKTDDFFRDYQKINPPYLYSLVDNRGGIHYGMSVRGQNTSLFLEIPLEARSYNNLKYYLDEHTEEIPSSYGLIRALTSFYDIDILCGFIDKVEKEIFSSHIIFARKNNEDDMLNVFCQNLIFSDLIGISKEKEMPVFIKNSIFDKYGTLLESF